MTTRGFIHANLIILALTAIAVTGPNVILGKYEKLYICSGTKQLTTCHLNALVVNSQLSCFKKCQTMIDCKSVNILYEDMKRYRCELNSCLEHHCGNITSTTAQYMYFYKAGKPPKGMVR